MRRCHLLVVGALAEQMRLDHSRVSRVVADLVKRGVLRREASQEDARRTLVGLTGEGLAWLDRMNDVKHEVIGQILSDWSREDFLRAIDANMLTPIALMQALVPAMAARGWGRVVNITSQAVRAPIPVLGLSNTARAGLTGFVAGMARQVAGQGVAVNNLLPGIHATERFREV